MSSRIKTDVKKLFEFWCEVKRAHGIDRTTRAGANAPAGIITESFPENFRDTKTIADITAFAYPCDFESDSVQSYSFVLTTDDSKWRFGFCRHDPKTNSAIVVITFLPWHDTFLRLLAVLAELRRNNNGDFRTFLTEAYNRGVPDPGSNLKLFYNVGMSYFVFERPKQFQLPSIPQNYNLNMYYNFADPKNMISVFAAMLAERRIIFTSRRLDRLSSCIQAANAFLYPMVWQHIFIPVLPMKLKDYLSAPMPYLIGVPEMVLETMTPDELGDVVTLNCDTKIFDSPFDDVHEMPPEIVSQLKKQLSQYHEHIGDRVSKIFLGVLVQLIGGYRDAVEFRDSGKTFNRDKFIESRPSHLRPFLSKMMELQIFQQFIDERLEMLNTGLCVSDEFELETVRYADKMKKRGRNYAFLKNVKDKTNPAVKSAVKSVKEGSRGVKTAYKDLKSKFRDITPPSNTHFRSHLSSNSQHDRIDGFVVQKPHRAGHHSAPSSPIFSKRSGYHSTIASGFQNASPEAISSATHASRRPNPLAMSNSTAHVQPNGFAGTSLGLHHHNNHLGTSPTVSPASSLCSSEMNLSQELQNHPLFKPPIVDRSLKPSSSFELSSRSRTGGPPPARPPLPSLHSLRQTLNHGKAAAPPTLPFYCNHPYAQSTSSGTPSGIVSLYTNAKPPIGARAALPSLQTPSSLSTLEPHTRTLKQRSAGRGARVPTPTNSNAQLQPLPPAITTGKIVTTDSIYDTPPNMQSPPVPPRRQCTHNIATLPPNVHSTAAVTATAKAQTLERNNCWPEYAEERSLLLNDTLRSSSSSNTSGSSASSSSHSNSSASFASALSSISQQPAIPVPAPRQRREKESLRSLQPKQSHSPMGAEASLKSVPSCSSQEDTMNDLISLDDSNNASFDLEDFDPLNQNARPLPLGGSVARKSGTLPSVSASQRNGPPAISNPIYPYFTQQHEHGMTSHTMPLKAPPLPTSLPPPMPPPDEDFELLRKYGLDQFTLTTPKAGVIVASKSNGTPINSVPMATTGMSNWTTFD